MKIIPIITLSTDFGYKDPLSGIMKGVILGINPGTNIVDITHGINKYDIREAALTVGMSYRQFPPRTIHVAVTDPGVGSSRRPILVVTENYYFVGPDNGIFSVVYSESQRVEVFHLTADHYFLSNRSATFHARDIFAPVAAWLSKGIVSSNFGELITNFVKLPFPVPVMPTRTTVEGEIIHIDHFGNAISNIKSENLSALRSIKPDGTLRIVAKGKQIALKEYYSQAEDKDLYALINSMDYLELFVCRGNASKDFELKVGDTLGVMLAG
ncbi:MAG: SAM-dependent chlorinase/fluorinase [Nitrospirae bacterium]|nr:SAM-dependent chlorinase/fluorinase [Nitrospirota bacterium]MCL5422079.1 SAM-dependent chlorinase/fluorinase [Nitrospirota bacterium]